MGEYNPFSLKGKTVLITGASSGIGRSAAVECSRMGARLIITGRNRERLEATYDLLEGVGHSMIVADITKPEETDSIIDTIEKLDGLIHSAGVIKRLPLKFVNEKNLNELMQVNFFGPALLTQKIAKKKLFSPEASVVFLSSVASGFASLGNIMYMASKGAVNSFMKGIAYELASSGVRVNAIQPGMISTPLSSQIEEDTLQKDLSNYPLQRYGKPEEVAWAAVYLLSDASKWMTGSILTLDGGLTLR